MVEPVRFETDRPPSNDVTAGYGGRHLAASHGRPVFRRETRRPEWIPSRYSIVSSGTELWHLSQTVGTSRVTPLGYMAIAEIPQGELVIAPVPHGASFSPDVRGCLFASGPLHRIVLARFQLVAAAAIKSARLQLRPDEATSIIGSGPVAIGAALELHRLGFGNVQVVSRRADTLMHQIATLEWLRFVSPDDGVPSSQVLDCVGSEATFNTALRLCRSLGMIGILGSPRTHGFSLYEIHRRGIAVRGLHELLLEHPKREDLFRLILQWIGDDADTARSIDKMVRHHDGDDAPTVYEHLASRNYTEIFHLFEWRDAD